MTDAQNAVKERDKQAEALGYVPRPLDLPASPHPGSVQQIRELLHGKAFDALRRRILGK